MSLATGNFLGPYEILGLIGSGGMGEVYRARDPRLSREVAIKVLSNHLADTPEARARFERESKAVAALSHPNIITIYDCGIQDDVSYAVTELLEGENLGDRIGRTDVPWRDALEIGIAVAEGLAAAHGKGIIHRDIKPANIFLTTAGVVKLLDFGLARLANASSVTGDTPEVTVSLETTPGSLIGTVHYMSPEQVRGQQADARSDIFSFGCVLYETVTGRRPFSKETAAETMVAILKEEPEDINASDRLAPPEFEDLIFHCMEKRPERRFQSAQDLAFNLGSLRSGSRLSAPKVGSAPNPNSASRETARSNSPGNSTQTAILPPSKVSSDHDAKRSEPSRADDPRSVIEDLKKDISRLRDIGSKQGTEALRKTREKLQEAQRRFGEKAPSAAERIEKVRQELEGRHTEAQKTAHLKIQKAAERIRAQTASSAKPVKPVKPVKPRRNSLAQRRLQWAFIAIVVAVVVSSLGMGASWFVMGLPGLSRSRESVTQERDFSIPVEGLDRLVIRTREGQIFATGASESDQIEVHAVMRASARSKEGAEDAMKALELVTEVQGGDQILEARWTGEAKSSWRRKVSFEVTVPAGLRLDAKSRDGRIEIENISADARLETRNGHIYVDGHEGTLDLESRNGRIRIDGQRGDLTADTRNGRIDAANLESSFRLSTENTPINVDLSDTKRIEGTITTSNGPIHIELGDQSSAKLSLKTDNGRFSVGDRVEVLSTGKKTLEGKIGDGSGSLTVTSRNSTIDVN